MGPLKEMKVLELAHVLAGPLCGMMLGDLGADVIKVEKIDGGDDTRRMTPPAVNGIASAFLSVNRSKRSIAIDLKSAHGKEAFFKLVQDTDVLIENFRPGTMEKLGLGYERLRSINPGLIYCQITGFGNNGPYALRAGFDLIAQGMSGIMSLTGSAGSNEPMKAGVPVADITAGLLAVNGILAAYAYKLKTGQGQMVDTSLLEAAIVHTQWPSAVTFATGTPPVPMGSAHPISAPYQAFPTADGWINIGAATESNWLRFVDMLGDAAIASPRFASNKDRMAMLPELVERLSAIFLTGSTAHWLEKLERAGVPAGPVLKLDEMHRDPQVKFREMVIQVDHPCGTKIDTLGVPIKFSKSVPVIRRGPPAFGQHSAEVLAEAGLSDHEIEMMLERREIAQPAVS